MKRMIAILLAVVTAAALLTGCSGRDNSNVSTTPDGNINGSNTTTDSNSGTVERPNAPSQNNDFQGAVTNPADSSNNNTDQNPADTTRPNDSGKEDSPMENFGDDMKDAAEDAMEDAENAMEDATGSRARASHSGTGMVGGR